MPQFPNSFDIQLDHNGFSLIRNAYGEILDGLQPINESAYRKMLNDGKSEIVENINSVLDDDRFKNVIVDLTGGMDSRIVFGAALQNENNRSKISINSYAVAGSNDLDISLRINNIYNLKWDITKTVKRELDILYSDSMHRSFYMGIYYSHNLSTQEVKMESGTIKASGACGEILLRPYIVRKYFNTELDNIKTDKEFLDYILRDYSAEMIVDYKVAKKFVDLHAEEFKNYGQCCLQEKIDRIYLSGRHAYHFDQGIISKHGTIAFMPLQSIELFKLHHNIYSEHRSIKLQLDMTNIMDPYLAAIPYESDKDNIDKKRLGDRLYYEKDYYKNICLFPLSDNDEAYNLATKEKQKNTSFVKTETELSSSIDFSHKILCDLQYLCNHNEAIKDNVGLAIWYYINSHNEEQYKRNVRYLYNKIASLKDQASIFID